MIQFEKGELPFKLNIPNALRSLTDEDLLVLEANKKNKDNVWSTISRLAKTGLRFKAQTTDGKIYIKKVNTDLKIVQ